MTNEPDDKPDGEDEDGGDAAAQERPTAAPPFDPIAFAQQVHGGRPSPGGGTPALAVTEPPSSRVTAPASAPDPAAARPRAQAATLTDPAELEAALLLSRQSSPPAPAPRSPPVGLLSLANARVPDLSSPRPAVPPSGAIPPTSLRDSASLGAAIEREWEELATSPPPAMQQDLIDASSPSEAPPSTKAVPDVAAAAAKLPGASRSVPPPPPAAQPRPAPAAPAAAPAPPSMQEMTDRVSLGDYSGALEIAEQLLDIDPFDDEVKVCAETCRAVLKQMYTTRIGPLDRVPVVMVARDQMRWLSIDHRAGFVLSLVDGVSSLEMILDVSGMPEVDALRILADLAQQRIIAIR